MTVIRRHPVCRHPEWFSRLLSAGLIPETVPGATGISCLKITIAQMLLKNKITIIAKLGGIPPPEPTDTSQ
jgi:hypothetical protein